MPSFSGTLSGGQSVTSTLSVPAGSASFSLTLTQFAGPNGEVGTPGYSLSIGGGTPTATGTVTINTNTGASQSIVNAGSIGANELPYNNFAVNTPVSAGGSLYTISVSGSLSGVQNVTVGGVFIKPQASPSITTVFDNFGEAVNFTESAGQASNRDGVPALVADTLSVGIDQGTLEYSGSFTDTTVPQSLTLTVPDVVYDGENISFSGTSSLPLANGLMQVIDGDLMPTTLAAQQNLSATQKAIYNFPASVSGTRTFSGQASPVDSSSTIRPYLGTHTLLVADAATGQLSNFATFTLAEPSTLTILTESSPIIGEPFTFYTVDVETPTATGLDYQLDGGSWVDGGVMGYVAAPASGQNGAGQGPVLTEGQHTFSVRNSSAPGVVSNVLTLTAVAAQAPPEQITLAVGAQAPSASVQISGTDSAPLASSMDYDLNGSGWQEVQNFVAGPEWTGSLGSLPAGTYGLAVRNSNSPEVVSNTVTFTLGAAAPPPVNAGPQSSGETLLLARVGGSPGSVATMTGVVQGATPSTLDISYDGGNTFPDTVAVQYSGSGNGTFTLIGSTKL